MSPLITNAKDLTPRQVLQAYKFQPRLEKRHELRKSVENVAPVYLKKVTRIQALLFFSSRSSSRLCSSARSVAPWRARASGCCRSPWNASAVPPLPPGKERILDLFMPLQGHRLQQRARLVQVFQPKLNELQQQVLALRRIPQPPSRQ